MEELIPKILAIFLRYGIKSVTMDDLARELGISKKTLYLHFNDKAHVVREAVRFMIKGHQRGMEALKAENELNAIDSLLKMSIFITMHMQSLHPSVTYDLQKYYPSIWEEVEHFKRKTIFNYVLENINQGVNEGLFSKALKPAIIAEIYMNSIDQLTSGTWQAYSKFDLEEVLKSLFCYHVRGIGTASGFACLEKISETLQWPKLKLNDFVNM
jgi:TetR/AcrR family transcriptional regulator, cholesterol catabolism regulator